MRKVVRIILGTIVVGAVLYAADLATRDCKVGPYVYDNCMWMRVRSHLGLPASRFLRTVTLEIVGIVLALILYLTFRYVFLFRRTKQDQQDSPHPGVPEPPAD
jgi:hypothetical protein